MDTKIILEKALDLSPAERLYIIEMLSQSLSETDEKIDKYWKEEVEQRYVAYKNGKVNTIPYDDIIKKWK